jgi:hypothetical protein
MLRRAYTKDHAKHAGNIVAEAMQDAPMMTLEELKKAWQQVSEVELPTGALDTTAVLTSTFGACIYDLSQVHSAFKLPCETCKFSQTCVTTKLEHPLFQRNDHHVVAVMKARAFWDGRTQVDVGEDLLPALQLVMLHRAVPKPRLAANYATLQEWYRYEIQDLLVNLQQNWKQAQNTIKEIKRMIQQANGDSAKLSDAVITYNKAIAESADVQSMKIVQTIEDQVNQLSQARFMKVYADAKLLAQSDYTVSDLDELKKIAESLTVNHAQEINREIAKLEGQLRGIKQVTKDTAMRILAELSKVEGRMLQFPSWREEHYRLTDGTELDLRQEHDKYVFDYNAKSSKIARIMRTTKA